MTRELDGSGQRPEERVILHALTFLRQHQRFLSYDEFLAHHSADEPIAKSLMKAGYLVDFPHVVSPTLAGLVKYGGSEVDAELATFRRLLPFWRDAYQKEATRVWSQSELAAMAGMPLAEAFVSISLLASTLGVIESAGIGRFGAGSYPYRIRRAVLSEEAIEASLAERTEGDEFGPEVRLIDLHVDGYRALDKFQASFGALTVIIGANASGKSSLFDLLAFIAFAAENPLPSEIDPRSVGKSLFHLGSPERLELAMVVDRGSPRLLRYSLQLSGPVGSPKIATESLSSLSSLSNAEDKGHWLEVGHFLDFKGGQGRVLSARAIRGGAPNDMAHSWKLPSNELALRRALDPNLIPINNFRDYVTGWRFYSGFDVGAASAIRRPVLSEPNPTLKEDGSNLSAVLFYLKTEHPEIWEELETHLRSAIPSFQSLTVKARGGPGTVIGIWRETGVKGELTLADLSDGTLKFLCWATLCLSRKASLICIDEPELGLHPRVLPVLAGLLRKASSESQLLVSTHSPYFLSQFSLEELAVMKKVDGRAVFARPASNESLRREIEELGSGELARLHISDELEVRS
ncbi:AAA family ATPase [Pyxidicoccus trucidator]|uniref:AAA family ATPase n=1 Tax=Pyxidicoccus trucidator TaxID=2709662 RepID=UPI0013DD0C90|nr:AAA family ATPase [Pyxidicoccus trucidator]